MVKSLLATILLAVAATSPAAEIQLPDQSVNASGGAAFAERIRSMSLPQREEQIRTEALAGNVPAFWRKFVSVRVRELIDGQEHSAEYFVAPDYFCIGSNEDYFRAPISPKPRRK